MKCDIILAGVGGQGILSIAATIGLAAVEQNLFLKQAEVHGMSQRGGDVQSHLRLSDSEIFSDLIPHGGADLIISVEPMEALRYLPWLSENGWLVTNSVPFVNISNYPEAGEVLAELDKAGNTIVLDADSIARDLGSTRSGNMVILGAASSFISMPFSALEDAVRKMFSRKGEEVVEVNLKALRAGRDAAAAR
ncbi:MAG TPA: indolepyruvate oxidoreductase subunit beta [Bacteroidales bacterium]|jgi:indolepyruvate ferredoxin oxidoreductase beta subunit|nr:indolepyruvate oxidoreductase subunit beta [Bacteroidales bacterium]MDI9532087.1 indolepyruvate oxidoreductase subunit beta [Bacteroidota bacterium]OPZ55737.1 MAG: indolepyruvate oxidoreductase subunit beta [Bacteroidetes bacterium ADurb.BinA012]MBK7731383.1 indolepyruvate oxidoreductase subunit beta [Bacteroidales bacterium]MBP7035206.1 indolepyruvate oxidoreductase subunit beta [Bacteroidales bacterium]